jgi:hypothetical protein
MAWLRTASTAAWRRHCSMAWGLPQGIICYILRSFQAFATVARWIASIPGLARSAAGACCWSGARLWRLSASPLDRCGERMARPYFPRMRHRALAIWRAQPVTVTWLYVLLLLAGSASGSLGHAAGVAPHPGAGVDASWLVTLWLVWRVSRRGQVSRWILIILGSGLGCVNAALHVPEHPAALILLVVYAGQLALLLSPALSLPTGPQVAAETSPAATN